jgi:NAD(P)H dehydrogenase (quinone)
VVFKTGGSFVYDSVMILIVHAHPEPDSFTSSIAADITTCLEANGKSVSNIDLYRLPDAERQNSLQIFPPVLEAEELHRKSSLEGIVQQQMKLVEDAQAYIIVHPDWWGGPPAVLKGWVDRVLRPGTAYEVPEGFGHKNAEGLLRGRRALVIVTGDGEKPGPLESFWTDSIWGYCGVETLFRYFPNLRESSNAKRRQFLTGLTELVTRLF